MERGTRDDYAVDPTTHIIPIVCALKHNLINP
jgi:hypothetical protein